MLGCVVPLGERKARMCGAVHCGSFWICVANGPARWPVGSKGPALTALETAAPLERSPVVRVAPFAWLGKSSGRFTLGSRRPTPADGVDKATCVEPGGGTLP